MENSNVVMAIENDNHLWFDFYLDEMVEAITPKYGPEIGGTRVSISGSNFLNTSSLSCRFGSNVVTAAFVSQSMIRCFAPLMTPGAATTIVYVSNNGIDFFSSRDISFQYVSQVEVLHVIPHSGPQTGGTIVTVTGRNFRPTEFLTCRFGLAPATAVKFISDKVVTCQSPPALSQAALEVRVRVSVNGIDFAPTSSEGPRFEYRQSPSVYSVSPIIGSTTGKTSVTISGSNFQAGNGLYCRFGNVAVPASAIWSAAKIVCTSSPHGGGAVDVEVTNDFRTRGKALASGGAYDALTQWTQDQVRFEFVHQPEVMSLHPSSGSVSGGTKIRVLGENFRDTIGLACRFSAAHTTTNKMNEESVIVRAHFIASMAVECSAPAWMTAGVVGLTVTVNGADYSSNAAQFEYHPTPVVTSLHPSRGMNTGGTVVTVTGSHFKESGTDLLCRFGHPEGANESIVAAMYISPEMIQCTSPPGVASPEVQRIHISGAPDDVLEGREIQIIEVI